MGSHRQTIWRACRLTSTRAFAFNQLKVAPLIEPPTLPEIAFAADPRAAVTSGMDFRWF